MAYAALTRFCRRQVIGRAPVVAPGRYEFEPGVKLQHDTSPHRADIAGNKMPVQTASAVLCYSRMLSCQMSTGFQRFDCKVLLTGALRYLGGAPQRVMIDNTHQWCCGERGAR